MGGGEHAHGDGHGAHGGDFRAKVWSMSGGPYCRPKHWKRNTAFAMFGVFLICIPIAMKSAELEVCFRRLNSFLSFFFGIFHFVDFCLGPWEMEEAKTRSSLDLGL